MIVRRHQQPLFNYIGRLVGERETALDFTQEVLLRAFASLGSFRGARWLDASGRELSP